MANGPLRALSDDEVWHRWRDDIAIIKREGYRLFSARRTFRNIAAVFRHNRRLQEVGGHVWWWQRTTYESYMAMQIRRETDDQRNTVNLNRLMREIAERPGVITRRRYIDMLALAPGSHLVDVNHDYFSNVWSITGVGNENDTIHPGVVVIDRNLLQDAAMRVQEVANQAIAHRARVAPEELQVEELDAALDVIEQTFQKYYVLLEGANVVQMEPSAQFDTHEVFTFPWIVPEGE